MASLFIGDATLSAAEPLPPLPGSIISEVFPAGFVLSR
jgi:hypothetical protein